MTPRRVRVALWLPGRPAPFVDEHVGVRWDDEPGARWPLAADVLWRPDGPAVSRAAAFAWCDAVLRRCPGALVVCAGYVPRGRASAGILRGQVAVRVGGRALRAYVTGRGGRGAEGVAAVGSLVHAGVVARMPMDRPLRIRVRGPEYGGRWRGYGGRWTVQLVPESASGAGSASESASGSVSGSGGSVSDGAPKDARWEAIRPASGAAAPS